MMEAICEEPSAVVRCEGDKSEEFRVGLIQEIARFQSRKGYSHKPR